MPPAGNFSARAEKSPKDTLKEGLLTEPPLLKNPPHENAKTATWQMLMNCKLARGWAKTLTACRSASYPGGSKGGQKSPLGRFRVGGQGAHNAGKFSAGRTSSDATDESAKRIRSAP